MCCDISAPTDPECLGSRSSILKKNWLASLYELHHCLNELSIIDHLKSTKNHTNGNSHFEGCKSATVYILNIYITRIVCY